MVSAWPQVASCMQSPPPPLPGQQRQQRQAHNQQEQQQAAVWLPDKQLWLPPRPSVRSSQASAASEASGAGLSRVFMASASARGAKRFMEDRHVMAALHPSAGVTAAGGGVGPSEAVSMAAVFDGHAGAATASYAAKHIPQLLHAAMSGRPGAAAGGGPVPAARGLLAPGCALASSFQWFDRWWADARCDPAFTEHGWDDSGSTAVVGMVAGQQLTVANAGDSIALLARGSSSQRLSVEHRLDNAAEAERVRGAGGRVVSFRPGAAPRVMGSSSQTRFKGSMVTRSLGDFAFKSPQPLLSAEPHVHSEALQPDDRLLVLASDGVSDVLRDDDVLHAATSAASQAQQRTNNGTALAHAAATAVVQEAMRIGATDNVTAVVLLLDWQGHLE